MRRFRAAYLALACAGLLFATDCTGRGGQEEPRVVQVPASVVDVPAPEAPVATKGHASRPRRSGVRVLFEESPAEGSIGLGEQAALLVDAALRRRPLPVGGIPVERSKGQVFVRDEVGVRKAQLEYLMFKVELEVVLNETRTCPGEGQSVDLELYWLESGLRIGRLELGGEAIGFELPEWTKQVGAATELVMQGARSGEVADMILSQQDLKSIAPGPAREKLLDRAATTFQVRELGELLAEHDFELLYRVKQLELVARELSSGRQVSMTLKLRETPDGFELVQSPLLWVKEFTARR